MYDPNNIFQPLTIEEAYAALIARDARLEAERRKAREELERAKKFERPAAKGKSVFPRAATNWPNDTAGYSRPKRAAEKSIAPLSPRERFMRLVAHFASYGRARREQKQGRARLVPEFHRTRLLGKPTPIPMNHWLERQEEREALKAAA